jgi:ribonuclease HII
MYCIEWVEPADIDKFGIETVLCDAGRSVYMQCLAAFPDSLVVMDGTLEHNIHLQALSKAIAFPEADGLIPAVSAASVIAKSSRDGYMLDLDKSYPGYGFGKHKGYPTAAHQERLDWLGASPVHRRSFKAVKRVETLQVAYGPGLR